MNIGEFPAVLLAPKLFVLLQQSLFAFYLLLISLAEYYYFLRPAFVALGRQALSLGLFRLGFWSACPFFCCWHGGIGCIF